MSEIKAKILVICPYPLGKAPSQRFRFEQFLPFLEEQGKRGYGYEAVDQLALEHLMGL